MGEKILSSVRSDLLSGGVICKTPVPQTGIETEAMYSSRAGASNLHAPVGDQDDDRPLISSAGNDSDGGGLTSVVLSAIGEAAKGPKADDSWLRHRKGSWLHIDCSSDLTIAIASVFFLCTHAAAVFGMLVVGWRCTDHTLWGQGDQPHCSHYMCQWLLVMALAQCAMVWLAPCWCLFAAFCVAWALAGFAHLRTLHHSCSSSVLDFSWYAVIVSLGSPVVLFSWLFCLAILKRREIREWAAGQYNSAGSSSKYDGAAHDSPGGLAESYHGNRFG